MAPKSSTKDFPLQLRRRQSGAVELTTETWPPRHEFSTDWLMRAVSDGIASVGETEITLTFANASATYQIVEPDEENPTTGVWGRLTKGSVD